MIKFPPIDAAAQMWEIFRDWSSNRAWNIARLIKRFFTRDPGGMDEPPMCHLCWDPSDGNEFAGLPCCQSCKTRVWREEHSD